MVHSKSGVITQDFLPRGKSPLCRFCCHSPHRRYSPNPQIYQHHGRATEVGQEGANVAGMSVNLRHNMDLCNPP